MVNGLDADCKDRHPNVPVNPGEGAAQHETEREGETAVRPLLDKDRLVPRLRLR